MFLISAWQKSVRRKWFVLASYQVWKGISAGPALEYFTWFIGAGGWVGFAYISEYISEWFLCEWVLPKCESGWYVSAWLFCEWVRPLWEWVLLVWVSVLPMWEWVYCMYSLSHRSLLYVHARILCEWVLAICKMNESFLCERVLPIWISAVYTVTSPSNVNETLKYEWVLWRWVSARCVSASYVSECFIYGSILCMWVSPPDVIFVMWVSGLYVNEFLIRERIVPRRIYEHSFVAAWSQLKAHQILVVHVCMHICIYDNLSVHICIYLCIFCAQNC